MNTKSLIVAASAIAIFAGCASQATAPASAEASTPSQLGACATNFSTEGSFWSGTRYSTFEEYPKKTVTGAFDALLRSVAANGYQINSTNKESGTISASQTVSYGQGKTAPLNFVVQKSAQGVRVDASFSTSGGVSAAAEDVKKGFCKLMAPVGQSANEVAAASAGGVTSKTADNNASAPTTTKKKPKKTATQ